MAKEPTNDPGVDSAPGRSPRVDGYVVSDLLGRGGYSRVYRARQVGFERAVALKVLGIGIETDDQQRSFERECRAMGVLSQHPNIVTVFNAAVTSSRQPCIVMELYSGGTLGDRVRRSGPIDVREVLDIGVRIAGALETAHARGVVHRDIKPQNLFVSEYGQPALGDFGISSFDDDRTITGGGGGLTVHYAPPELLEGGAATAASDVYSLAATLFTLASGARPFPRHDGQTLGELARQILVQPAPRLDGPAALADLLQEAMAKQPEGRPETADAFGARLQSIQDELGFARTEMVTPSLAGAASSAETVATLAPVDMPGSGADDSETVGTVGAPAFGESATADAPRRRTGLLVTAAVVVSAVVAAAIMSRSPGSDAGSNPVIPVTVDDFFSAPAAPTGVVIERSLDGTSARVFWAGGEDLSGYQVERLDTGVIVEVPAPEATIALPAGAPVCVTVTAIGGDGKLSPPSETVCSE